LDDSGSEQTARSEILSSLGESQRTTLDRLSFEEVVSATSLIQQLNRKVRNGLAAEQDDAEPLSDLVEAQLAIETGAIDLEATLNRVVRLAVRLKRATGAAAWLFAGPEFVYRAGIGNVNNDEGLQTQVLSKLASICGPSDRLFYDPRESNDWSPAPDAIHYPGSSKSWLVAPIYHGRSIAGALAVFSVEFNAFAERDAIRARLLCGLLTHALGKAAEVELKQKVSLERATMLEAIGQLMPALRMLAEGEKRESHRSPNEFHSPVTEPEPGPELTTVQAQGVIARAPGDDVLENFPSTTALKVFIERTDVNPGVYPIVWGEKGQPLDAGDNSPSALGTEPIPARESTRVPAPTNNATLRVGVRAIAARIQKNFLFGTTIGLADLARRQRSKGRFWLSNTMERTLGRFPDIGIAWNQLRVSIPAGFRLKQRVLSAAAVPAAVLLILLVFLFLKTTSSQPSDQAAVATSEKSAVAKLATASVPFQGVQQHPGVVPTHQLSHMQVTDPTVSSALYSLSRYEIVGLRRRALYGDDVAALLLGMAYETGHLVPQDCITARAWVTKSANEGNAAAEYNLGLRYRQGDGQPANQEVGAQWLEKAAAQKYSQAQFALESVP